MKIIDDLNEYVWGNNQRMTIFKDNQLYWILNHTAGSGYPPIVGYATTYTKRNGPSCHDRDGFRVTGVYTGDYWTAREEAMNDPLAFFTAYSKSHPPAARVIVPKVKLRLNNQHIIIEMGERSAEVLIMDNHIYYRWVTESVDLEYVSLPLKAKKLDQSTIANISQYLK